MFSSCSTSQPIRQAVVAQQELIEDTVKEDRIVGGALPSWVRKSGIENGMVFAVGKAEFDVNRSPFYVEKAAQMDAEVKLLTDAPSDFRILTQNAMTGAGIDSAEFYQVQTKLQEVVGLTGIRIDEEKIVCRKIIRYGNLSTRITRACYVQAFIPIKQLVKAYQRTLALKFGDYKAGEFKNLMNQELDNINNNHLLRGKHEKKSDMSNFSNNDDVNNSKSNGVRLRTKKVKPSQRQQSLSTEDSKSRKLQSSLEQVKKSDAQYGISATDKSSRAKDLNSEKLLPGKKTRQVIESGRRSLAKVRM